MYIFRNLAKSILPLFFVLSVCLVKAETASYDDVQKVARNFMKRSFGRTDSIIEVVKFDTLNITTMYAFNFEKGGYVLVSGSYNADPILAYSKSETFLPKDSIKNNGIIEFLNDCKSIILCEERMLENTRAEGDSESEKKWNEWFSEKEQIPYYDFENSVLEVEDLLYDSLRGGSVKWNQEGCANESAVWDWNLRKYISNNINNICYNAQIPAIEGCREHGYTGCVPVSLGQVMWKWKWPLAVSYTHNEVVEEEKFEKKYYSEYTWDSMPTRLEPTSTVRNMNEISTLLRDCGYMLNASYECRGTSANNSDIYNILIKKNLIGYNCYGIIYTSDCINRNLSNPGNIYSTSDWTNVVITELIAGRPVIVGGIYKEGDFYYGHSYVVSGFQKKIDGYYLYINFGWSGYCDSYYNMDFANTPKNRGESYAFTNDKEAVIGLSPRKNNESGIHNINAYCSKATIDDKGKSKLSFYVENANSYIAKVKYTGKEVKASIREKVGDDYIYSRCQYSDKDIVIYRSVGNLFKDGIIELWYSEKAKLTYEYKTKCDSFSAPLEYEVSFLNNYGQVETYKGFFVEEDGEVTHNEIYLSEDNISISPNPSTGFYILDSYTEKILKITVSDISGKKLKVIDQIKSQQKSLDLSDFPSGCYFVIVETEHSRIVKKIIKK